MLWSPFLKFYDSVMEKKTLFTVLRVKRGVFEVLSTAGDMHLGGDDFDKVYDVLRSHSRFLKLVVGIPLFS